MTLIGIELSPYAMFLATLFLLVSFRHATPVSRSCVSLVPATHSLIGPVPYTWKGMGMAWRPLAPPCTVVCIFRIDLASRYFLIQLHWSWKFTSP